MPSLHDLAAYYGPTCFDCNHSVATGPLCGVCAQGFGSTAPFNCQHCYSAKLHATAHADDGVTQEARPNKVDMSLLYVWYWVALTFWCLWSIGSAFTPAHSSADSQKEAEAGKPRPTPPFDVIKVGSGPGARESAPLKGQAGTPVIELFEKRGHASNLVQVTQISLQSCIFVRYVLCCPCQMPCRFWYST